MTTISSNLYTPKCNQCGGKLVPLTRKTERVEGRGSPITTITYRCLNKSCQDEIDKKTRGRIKLKKEQDREKKNRADAKTLMRLNKNKILR